MTNGRARTYSITARLALLFALSLATLSLAAEGYLYHALTLDLTSRDDNELHGKLALAIDALDSIRSLRFIGERSTGLAHVVVGHEQLTLYVIGPDDHLLFATGHPRVPVVERQALLQIQSTADVRERSRIGARAGDRGKVALGRGSGAVDRVEHRGDGPPAGGPSARDRPDRAA